jgi:hypothetical protein
MVLAPFWKSSVHSVALAVRNRAQNRLFRMGEAGWSAQSGLSLHLWWRIGEHGNVSSDQPLMPTSAGGD